MTLMFRRSLVASQVNKHGVCVQCCLGRCTTSYHVTCAKAAGIQFEIDEWPLPVYSSCAKHQNQPPPHHQSHSNAASAASAAGTSAGTNGYAPGHSVSHEGDIAFAVARERKS